MKIEPNQKEINGLLEVANNLREDSRNLASLYHSLGYYPNDMEDCKDYIKVQESISQAIREVSNLIGSVIATNIISH